MVNVGRHFVAVLGWHHVGSMSKMNTPTWKCSVCVKLLLTFVIKVQQAIAARHTIFQFSENWATNSIFHCFSKLPTNYSKVSDKIHLRLFEIILILQSSSTVCRTVRMASNLQLLKLTSKL